MGCLPLLLCTELLSVQLLLCWSEVGELACLGFLWLRCAFVSCPVCAAAQKTDDATFLKTTSKEVSWEDGAAYTRSCRLLPVGAAGVLALVTPPLASPPLASLPASRLPGTAATPR